MCALKSSKNKKPTDISGFLSEGRRIRTFDRLLRRQVLYPAELCLHCCCKKLVGVAGFEPAASCSQSRRDNRATLHPESLKKAESKGFEPLVQFPIRMFSKHVLSASQATLHAQRTCLYLSGCKCNFLFYILQIKSAVFFIIKLKSLAIKPIAHSNLVFHLSFSTKCFKKLQNFYSRIWNRTKVIFDFG